MKTSIFPELQSTLAREARLVLDFWNWWTRTLGDVVVGLPVRSRRNSTSTVPNILVSKRGATFETDATTFPLDTLADEIASRRRLGKIAGDTINLIIGADFLHYRLLSPTVMPISIARDMAAIDQVAHTPFPAKSVYIEVPQGHGAPRGTGYFIIRKDKITELKTCIAKAGAIIEAMYLRDDDGNLHKVRFENSKKWRPRGVIIAFVVLLIVSAVCGVILFEKITAAQMHVEEQISRIHPQADTVRRSFEKRQKLIAELETAATGARRKTLVVTMWEELSKIIPDDAFLTELSIDNDRVEITGFSKASANLIGIIEDNPMFSNVKFSSPVTRVPGNSNERFAISMTQAAND